MANEKLSQLPDAPLPLNATDLAYVVSGGTSYKTEIQNIASLTNGNLNVKGGWDASTNTPALASSVGTAWDAYVVTTGGNTELNGIKTWFVGDIFWFNGETNSWQRITNTNYYYPFTVAGYFNGATGEAYDNGGQPVGTLTSGVGVPWHAYGVGAPGNYILDGNGDWEEGQTAMFNGITNQWFKFPAMALNGRTGVFTTFPANQGEIMFGSADNWIDQDGNLFWDKAATILKLGPHAYSGGQRSLLLADGTGINTNIVDSISILGQNGNASNVTNSAILPGGVNTFSGINNCVMGGGFGNNISNVSNGVFLGMAAANIDCGGFNWHVVLCGTDTQNTGFKFTQINSDSIHNGSGNYCMYLGTYGVRNTSNLSNVTCMGFNGGLFTPPYSDQLNLFYDNGLCIDRYGGRASITVNNLNRQAIRTTFPLSVYICSPEDQIILGANTNAGASLTFVLPDESNFIDGFEVYLYNISGNMGAAAVAQSGTGKLINGAATYNINALNRAWVFIWMQSNNEWHAFSYQLT